MAYLLIGPDETLNYTFDWSDSVGEETIVSSSFSIMPTGPELTNQTHTDTTATAYLSGCEVGQVYRLTNQVVTSAETTEERSVTLRGYVP